MPNHNIILSGFGGQGILFAGKVIAYAGLIESKEVSWLPSYGPEMRGGTANCSVVISQEKIGSPLVINPSGLIVMNLPSYDKFIGDVKSGGLACIDSSLINKTTERTDIKAVYLPATSLANEKNLKGLANIILIGALLKYSNFASFDSVKLAIEKSVPSTKQHLVESNIKAIELGMTY